VIAKVEWHPGELYPRIGFIVTNLSRPAERVVAFIVVHNCIATLCMTIARAEHLRETDCVAGHAGLELRNVDANYLFERSHRFAGIQLNSGFGNCSPLSCGIWRYSAMGRDLCDAALSFFPKLCCALLLSRSSGPYIAHSQRCLQHNFQRDMHQRKYLGRYACAAPASPACPQ
jgi:hypothetical protein